MGVGSLLTILVNDVPTIFHLAFCLASMFVFSLNFRKWVDLPREGSKTGCLIWYPVIFDLLCDSELQHRFLFLVGSAFQPWYPLLSNFQLFQLISMSPTLRNVLRSITMGARQLNLTLCLGLITMYLFSNIGFFAFHSAYVEGHCNDLLSCYLATINMGLTHGAGLAEYFKEYADEYEPDVLSPDWGWKSAFGLAFYACVSILFLNLIFGILIDN